MIHNLRVCFAYCRVIHKPFWSTELIVFVDGIACFMYEICTKSSECLFQHSSGRLKKCREKSKDKFYAHQKSNACCFFMDESNNVTIFRLLVQASKLYIQIVGKKLWTSWCIGLSWCWIACEWCWIIIILLKVFHPSDFYVWRLFLTLWPLLLEECVAQSIGKIT